MSEGRIAPLVAEVKAAPGLHYKNPRFPINIKLADNLECGAKIYIHGAAAQDANRFAFNLKNAEIDANNYFHFNPRFDEGCVVRNSRIDESWADEERDGDMPFVQGEPFLITIHPTVDCYEVQVNGEPFINFPHREGMPPCDVTHIAMWGDVTIYGIHVPLGSIPIPLLLRIPKHVHEGDIVHIRGETPAEAQRFQVNFQIHPEEDSDIIHHFNPRFDKDTIVANSRLDGSWGEEHTVEGLAEQAGIAAGEPLEVCLATYESGFQAFLNNHHVLQWPHRVDFNSANYVTVDGDYRLSSVTYECAPVKLPPQVASMELDTFATKTKQSIRQAGPVKLAFPEGFGTGRGVYVSGKVHEEPQRFEVNLMCGSDDLNVAIHVNPRWSSDVDLVMNHREDGGYGEEERVPNPIASNEEVEVFVLCQDDGYQVIVNGDLVHTFAHRIDASRVDFAMVEGDIDLYRVLTF